MQEFVLIDGHNGKPGNSAEVTPEGSVRVQTTGEGSGTVSDVDMERGTLGTTSSTILSADATRTQIHFQNQDPTNAIHLSLSTVGATATDFRVDPGASFTFPPGATYQGPVNAIATGAGTNWVAIVYREQSS